MHDKKTPRKQKLTSNRCKPYLKKVVQNLKNELGRILISVALFGSVARNEGGPHSDIDLLIVHKKTNVDLTEKLVQIEFCMEDDETLRKLNSEGYHPRIFPLFLSEEELQPTPWVLLDIQDHGIILMDKNNVLKNKFEELRRKLRELGARKIVLPDGTWYWDLKPYWKPGEVIEL